MIIPWVHGYDWEQVTQSIIKSASSRKERSRHLQTLAGEIAEIYKNIDNDIEKVSQKTCPSCSDVCCMRATVWYDLKDLLYIYYSSGELPLEQIYRRDDGSCCHLSTHGCILKRSLRPFICTWYICPTQKREMGGGGKLVMSIDKVKELRKRLEKLYR